jgi:hypothetical protein
MNYLQNALAYLSSSALSEASVREIVETVRAFADYRLKEQTNILSNVKAGSDLNVYLLEDLDEQTESFMSSEYISLVQSLISLAHDRSFNTNVQYEASESVARLFAYSVAILFSPLDDCVRIFDTSIALYVHRFNQETLELTSGLGSPAPTVRETSLKCLQHLISEAARASAATSHATTWQQNEASQRLYLDPSVHEQLTHRLIVTCFDAEASNRALAEHVWQQGSAHFTTTDDLCLAIVDDLTLPFEQFRSSGAQALAHLVKMPTHRAVSKRVMIKLISKYAELNRIVEPAKPDQYGRVAATSQALDVDHSWELRSGIGEGLAQLAESIPGEADVILELFTFFVHSALNDRHQDVRNRMLEAAIAALNYHGRDQIAVLLPLLEEFLQEAPRLASYDSVRQNVVILMGTLAKHLDKVFYLSCSFSLSFSHSSNHRPPFSQTWSHQIIINIIAKKLD